jgi:hypothetical protein
MTDYDRPSMSRRVELAVVVAVLLSLVAAEVDAARRLSTTFDERPHLAAGFSSVVHREVWLNPEHPPLVKLLSGAALMAAGGEEGPAGWFWSQAHLGPSERTSAQWFYGDLLINRANGDLQVAGLRPGAASVLFVARLPLIVFPVLLALVAWAWGRSRFGAAGGLVALALAVTYPDVLGHGVLVTTDVPVAALSLAAAFALDRLAHEGGARWLAAFALAVALALAAKFTATLVVPVLGAVALVAARRPVDPAPAGPLHPFGQGPAGARYRWLAVAVLVTALVAYVVLWACYLGDEPIAAYRHGMSSIYHNRDPHLKRLCLGYVGQHFWWYFLVCVALKAPLGTLAIFALAAWAARSVRGDLADESLLTGTGLVLFVAVSVLASPLGSRYAIPPLAFLFVSAGRVGPWAGRSRGRWAAIVLALAANVVATAIDHPFHAASSNALAGDARTFYTKLDDSNQDWGQGLAALGDWQRRAGVDSVVVITRIPNPDPVQLDEFGVKGELRMLDAGPLWGPEKGKVYAVSAHVVARSRIIEAEQEREARLSGQPALQLVLGDARLPDEIVGGAFLIFDLRER